MPNNISIFLIGFFASICAVFVPRMVAMLNAVHSELHYFKQDYVLIGIAFAAVIGGITVIFEQGKNKKASETFMTALGIPALLAGALNTGTAGNEVGTLQADNQKLKASLAQGNGISIEKKASTIVPLEKSSANSHSSATQTSFTLINVAQAADGENAPQKNAGLQLGIQKEQAQYLIVLNKLNSREKAIQEAEELRKTIPKATAVQSDQNFLVIDGEGPLGESDALLKAIKIKNGAGLKPYLLQAK